MAAPGLLKPETCFLHVVDVQESLMRQIHNAEAVAATVKLMLRCSKILGLSILANTQYRKGLGVYVPELEELMDGIPRPDKVEFNAFANNETAALVDKLPASVTCMLIVGVETHICIHQTAMGALARGITPYIVSDAVSSRTPENHRAGLARMQAEGCVVGPAEMFIYEMLGKAGSPEFKQILPFIVEKG
ncbi:isochorismatase family protein [Desulfopila sp. IMCC35008]|uniref:isochorismatase family protein n=1 Tax=Desulfopila sp. IMCC35008 TaxID=2653858 RepID=UPI0013D6A24A|nr:isochorismatase family protein [Desulfopila sp. IMCC35008]